jgi:hypothetical protein
LLDPGRVLKHESPPGKNGDSLERSTRLEGVATINLPRTPIESHWSPSDFEGWALDAAFLTGSDVPALVCRIEELEEELDKLHVARAPIKGGPRLEWDAWILALSDNEFLECLRSDREGDRLKLHGNWHPREMALLLRDLRAPWACRCLSRTGGTK